jgi:hypothetical protein
VTITGSSRTSMDLIIGLLFTGAIVGTLFLLRWIFRLLGRSA